MSVYDRRMQEIAAQRAAKRNAEIYRADTDTDLSATGETRVFCVFGVIAGIFLAMAFPPLGLITIGFFGLVLLMSPAMDVAEKHMEDETDRQVKAGTGKGCGAFLMALVIGIVVILLAMSLVMMAVNR